MPPLADKRCPDLPIVAVLPDIINALDQGNTLVLQASPGAGKTTLVPLALLDRPWLQGQRIIMLEPRRVAARGAAARMADLLGETCGETVGYRVRQDSRVGRNTRLEVVTEGVFTRMLLEDPSLDGIGLVILDEFHERSLDADLGLALSLQARELFRDADNPLRLLVMSATLDSARLAPLLGDAPVIDCPVPQHPLTLNWWPANPRRDELLEQCRVGISDQLQRPADDTGHLLVFLPGRGEIERLQGMIKVPSGTVMLPLHGGLELSAQQQVIAPSNDGLRKVVLATNIAETSLTIDGVHTVIDSGYAREPVFDPGTGMTRLNTRRISRASATQRAGRAARLGPGRCIRLWTEALHPRLEEHAGAEILQADLAPLALTLLAWGVASPDELSWIDPPPAAAWSATLDLLVEFGAIEKRNHAPVLTDIGARMAALPMHPRLARMIVEAEQLDCATQATLVAAAVSDPPRSNHADLRPAIDNAAGEQRGGERDWRQRVQRQARQWQRALALDDSAMIDPAALLAFAYPDRIAQRRGSQPGLFQLASGRSAALDAGDALAHAEWLVVTDSGGAEGRQEDRIFRALRLDPALFDSHLASLVRETEVAQWDNRVERFVAERRRQIGALVLARSTLTDIAPEVKRTAVFDLVRRRGMSVFDWPPALRQWQARVGLLRLTQPESDPPWPDLSDDALLNTLDSWFAEAALQINRLEDFRRIKLEDLLTASLPWPLPAQLDTLAPTHITVPSGSRISIDYSSEVPVLAVKLQEMFGCDDTPRIANGRVALLVHLLSPAGRPLQVTGDLAGFWRSSYQDVRKDMRGRYPKHPWPENPLDATPTRHTKARAGQS